MIVSIATAVFPVCLSPIISSLCPRPIGTMESTDFKPVWTGWSTDFLSITPGAIFSIGEVSLAFMGPLLSIGSPREFTTLPNNSFPTGTSKILPVHFTGSPSKICL